MRYEDACKASPVGCAVRRWGYRRGLIASSPEAAVEVMTEYEELQLPPPDGRCFRRAPLREHLGEHLGAWEVLYARQDMQAADDWEPADAADAARWRSLLAGTLAPEDMPC